MGCPALSAKSRRAHDAQPTPFLETNSPKKRPGDWKSSLMVYIANMSRRMHKSLSLAVPNEHETAFTSFLHTSHSVILPYSENQAGPSKMNNSSCDHHMPPKKDRQPVRRHPKLSQILKHASKLPPSPRIIPQSYVRTYFHSPEITLPFNNGIPSRPNVALYAFPFPVLFEPRQVDTLNSSARSEYVLRVYHPEKSGNT